MILNDRQITALAANGMIEPFEFGEHRPGVISYGVTSFGYDMRVADEWMMHIGRGSAVVDPKRQAPSTETDDPTAARWVNWRLPFIDTTPGGFYLCRSVEYFRIPDDVLGIVVGKSTYARCGLIVNCTPMEPGWHGHLTIELHNASQHSIRVYANEGIAQVVFHRGERPSVTYADKGGKYQGQTGVTLGRVE